MVQYAHHKTTTLEERKGEREGQRDKEGERENGILMSQPSGTNTDALGMILGIHSTNTAYTFISTG